MASSSSPITFTGTSTFSSDFQQVITRAVAIASLPIRSLQNNVTALSGKQTALTGLNANFLALQTALVALGSATQGSPVAQVSDSTSLRATASAGALNGTYTVQVDDIGAATTTLSKAGLTTVTDPASTNISSASSFTLTVNGTSHQITPTGSSLASLVSAINAAGNGVQATAVNVGSNASPDYRIAITSNNLDADTIQLSDGTNLLDTLSTGTKALYKINGAITDVQSTSRDLTLSPGLNITLLHNSAAPVSITVTTNYSAIQSSLSNIASAYNAAFDALGQQRGQSGGALSGDSLVFSLGNVLRQVSQYNSGSGSVDSLTALGLTLGQDGHLTFDSTAFASLSPTSVQAFLGDIGSSGFVKTANDALSSVTDATTGLIPTDVLSIQSQITSQNSKIADQHARVDLLQANLQQQLSQADAAIATLQAQKTYFAELFTATYGNGTGTNGTGG